MGSTGAAYRVSGRGPEGEKMSAGKRIKLALGE